MAEAHGFFQKETNPEQTRSNNSYSAAATDYSLFSPIVSFVPSCKSLSEK